MTDLVEFLRARNGEARERAMFLRTLAAALPSDPTALHEIADWIEADTEAKRQIINELEQQISHCHGCTMGPEFAGTAYECDVDTTRTRTLQLLALPYTDHPDREEQKP